jgi:glycosyltransferase involved in cell wall biosynthesis
VKNDYRALAEHFDVTALRYQSPRDVLKILCAVLRADAVFGWFADRHTALANLLAKLLGKRAFLVVGGYDVANVPKMAHGIMRKPLDKIFAMLALRCADDLLCVSEFVSSEAARYASRAKIKVVYNGVDVEKFTPANEKENLVLTVTTGGGQRVRLTGLDTFVAAAELLPRTKFVIVGLSRDAIAVLEHDTPPNLALAEFLPQQKLLAYYRRAKVYCQLSYYEAFGVALVEAMLCECVPVVTRRGALPEVVGNTGFYVPYGDARATATAVKRALKRSGKKARARALALFSSARRAAQLRALITARCATQSF